MTESLRIAGLAVALSSLAFVTACSSGGSTKPTSEPTKTATAGPAISGAGAQPTSVPSPTPTAAPPTPVPTPTPVPPPPLPTPLLPGFPVLAVPPTSPDREIIDLINRNGPAYSRALAERSESYLNGIFTGEALAQYSADVVKERAKPARTQTALLAITLVSADHALATASVATKERWRYQSGSTCTIYNYDEFYQLIDGNSGWLISKNQFVQTSTSGC